MAGLCACSTTLQSTDQEHSGSLTDYGRIERSESGKGAYWAALGFEISDYSAIRVPDVELWSKDSLEEQDARRIAELFKMKTQALLADEGWAIVTDPGSGVLSLRLALTELQGANRFRNFMTSIPYASTSAI